MRILDNTLSLTLKDDNEIVIGAKIYSEVSAKTWIWKGINFGLLGCLKINSCSGQIVTYSANIDTKVSFRAIWDKTTEKLSIKIKPVETSLEDVNVAVSSKIYSTHALKCDYFNHACLHEIICYVISYRAVNLPGI